jgi:hypothetical protein
LEESVP